ncbi:MAG: ECF-type sigma factor [Gammaproteobacteria bacterium]
MDGENTADLTLWIRQSRNGHPGASDKLYAFAYDRLKGLARRSLGSWRSNDTLDPTSLVHEFFIKHTRARQVDVEDRRHFYNLAARMMRQIMINSAKAKYAQKRHAGQVDVEFMDGMLIDVRSPENLLIVDEVLDGLEKSMPEIAEVFLYRAFARMTIDEIADVVGVAPATVKRRYKFARAYVMRKMEIEE